ncbi:oxalate:formate antiporter [Aplysia californica]|uniref:Oxalate:formate antiporter n=1 Tax=Aplysia californica TaxID=6500 RepID=A0ABM0K0K5_APLCA|nr:oxalate:formate antiporter [Aplysia californica]
MDSMSISPSKSEAGGADDEFSTHPLEMLKSPRFYCLWFMMFCNGQGSIFVAALYKAYGQTFISDDTFLALVGAFAAIFNGLGRIFWGIIADKISFRVSMLLMTAAFTCLMLTFNLTSLGDKAYFFAYVCLLFGCFSGTFSLFPTASAKCFGPKYLGINYGLLFSSLFVTSLLCTFLSQTLKSLIGWEGLFFLIAGFSFISFVLAMCFKAKDRNGKEI